MDMDFLLDLHIIKEHHNETRAAVGFDLNVSSSDAAFTEQTMER